MIHNVAAILSFQIEVGVVGKVHDRRLVRRGLIFNLEHVVISPPVGDGTVHIPRKAFLAVRAEAGETHADPVIFHQGFRVPNLSVKAVHAAVADDRLPIELFIRIKPVLNTVKGEFSAIYPVAETADDRSEEPFLAGLEGADVSASLHDIVNLAVTVRNVDSDDTAAVISDLHTGSGRVDKAVNQSRSTIRQGAEAFAGDTSGESCRRAMGNGSQRQEQC